MKNEIKKVVYHVVDYVTTEYGQDRPRPAQKFFPEHLEQEAHNFAGLHNTTVKKVRRRPFLF